MDLLKASTNFWEGMMTLLCDLVWAALNWLYQLRTEAGCMLGYYDVTLLKLMRLCTRIKLWCNKGGDDGKG